MTTSAADAAPDHPTADGGAQTPYAAARDRVRAGGDVVSEAAALVDAMTVEEKLGCLDGDLPFWSGLADMMRGGYYEHTFPAAHVDRLGFPGIDFADGPRGAVVGHATCFPVSMARGASFDPDLEERIGEAIGTELRIQGATLFGGVCVNLLRHPAWGRAQETYGEDPHHVGAMGAALTRGVQRHVMACVKHFACNSMENARFTVDVTASDVALDEVYLPHFERIVREGVACVMSAYNSLNGEWCGENHRLLTEILRDRWGFDGFVISDFVFGLRDPVKSVVAGMEIEMPFRQQREQVLAGAVTDGSLPIDVVDQRVANVVRTVLRFDAATPDVAPDASLLAGAAHRALALEAAEKSIVLLRNEMVGDAPVLPIASSTPRIAVVGDLADRVNLGDGGSSDVHPPYAVTPLAGIRAAFGDATFVDDPAAADLAVVVVGYTKTDEGECVSPSGTASLGSIFPPMTEADASAFNPPQPASDDSTPATEELAMAPGGDRVSLRLRADDEALIARVAAVQPRTVVVVVSGSAVVMPWADSVAGIVQLWYAGMEGGTALGRVLGGAVNPCGRLPFAVPHDEAHLVPFDRDATKVVYDEWHGQWLLDRDRREVAFPFGFGLSYADFEIVGAERRDNDITVTVANQGTRSGDDVVFVFRMDRGVRKLCAFARVHVGAGSTATVTLTCDAAGPLVVAHHARDEGVAL